MTYLMNRTLIPIVIMIIFILALLFSWGLAEPAHAQGGNSRPVISVTAQDDITEGDDAIFDITASSAPLADLIIPVNVTEWPSNGGFAEVGGTGSKNITIAAGTTKTTLTVGTVDDSKDEPRGIIAVTLGTSNAWYRLSSTSQYAIVVVSDNDAAVPSIGISSYSLDAIEHSPIGFKVTANRIPEEAVTVSVNIVATGSYGISNGVRTVVIPTTDDNAMLLINPIDDTLNEAPGTVTATIQTSSHYTVSSDNSVSVTLNDDDIPEITVSPGADIMEGDPASFTLVASNEPYQELSVSIKISTKVGTDVTESTRVVTIPASELTKTFTVDTIAYDNNILRQDGTITVEIQPGEGYIDGHIKYYETVVNGQPYTDSIYIPNSGVVNMLDNDLPDITITSDGDITEGSNAVFTVSSTPNPVSPLTVNLKVEDTGSYQVNVRKGQTAIVPTSGSVKFTLTTEGDAIDEPDGSAIVTILPGLRYNVGDPAKATVSISDDDATIATRTLTVTGGSDVTEGEDAKFTITASPPLAEGEELKVNIDIENPHTINPRGVLTDTITGENTEVTVITVDNNKDEPNYEVSYILRGGNGYVLGDPSKASVTVLDNDVPIISIHGSPENGLGNSINENGKANFSLKANPNPHQDVTVAVEITTEGDFGITTGTKNFTLTSANHYIGSFSIIPVPDNVDEDDGSVTVSVKPSSDYDIASDASSATIIIKDDDEAAVGSIVTIANAPDKARAGGKLVFAITLNEASTGEISMDYEIGHFSALLIPEEDYWDDASTDQAVRGSITIAPGDVEAIMNVRISPYAWFNHNDRIYVALDNLKGDAKFEHSFAEGRLNAR